MELFQKRKKKRKIHIWEGRVYFYLEGSLLSILYGIIKQSSINYRHTSFENWSNFYYQVTMKNNSTDRRIFKSLILQKKIVVVVVDVNNNKNNNLTVK